MSSHRSLCFYCKSCCRHIAKNLLLFIHTEPALIRNALINSLHKIINFRSFLLLGLFNTEPRTIIIAIHQMTLYFLQILPEERLHFSVFFLKISSFLISAAPKCSHCPCNSIIYNSCRIMDTSVPHHFFCCTHHLINQSYRYPLPISYISHRIPGIDQCSTFPFFLAKFKSGFRKNFVHAFRLDNKHCHHLAITHRFYCKAFVCHIRTHFFIRFQAKDLALFILCPFKCISDNFKSLRDFLFCHK